MSSEEIQEVGSLLKKINDIKQLMMALEQSETITLSPLYGATEYTFSKGFEFDVILELLGGTLDKYELEFEDIVNRKEDE